MISTSAEYQTSIAKRTGRQTFAKLEINYTDPFVDQSIAVTVSGDAEGSHKDQVANGIYQPSHLWFSLDGSSLLDGTYKLMPPTSDTIAELSLEMGWWSADAAGVGGAFASPQVLTVVFAERTIESLLVCADSLRHEYPVDFTIKLYDSSDTLLHTETVTGNTLEYWTASISAVTGVVKQVLSITKWSHANRSAKIYEFFTAIKRTYYGDEIMSLELLEERESDQASIPVGNISSGQLTAKIHNKERQFDYGSPSPISDMIKPMRKLVPYLGAAGAGGVTEYIPLGVFWSQEWNVPDDDLAVDTVGYDLLSLMAKKDYAPELMTDVSLYDIIENICQSFGLLVSMYAIDAELDVDTIPYVWIDRTNCREALRVAIEAGLASGYADRLGVLQIEGPNYLKANSATSLRTIMASEYFGRKNPSRYSTISNVVKVKTFPLVPDSSASSVYANDSVQVPAYTTVEVEVNFSESPCIDAVASLVGSPAGLSITDAEYHSSGAVLTIENTLSVQQVANLDVQAKILRVVGSRTAVARDEASITEFGEQVYEFPDNPLVQDYELAEKIANGILSIYSSARRDLSQEWRGDPALELGDRITTDSSRTTTDDFWIIRQTLSWDGTLSAEHEGILVLPPFLLSTEDGFLLETEDGYILETE